MSSVELTRVAGRDAQVRKTIFGYDATETIGTGAGSTLYLVRDPSSRQQFALKHVIRNEERDIRFVQQLEAEFQVSRNFHNPALRKAFDLKIHRSLLRRVTEAALILEYFNGTPLDRRLPKSMVSIVKIFIQTANGLDALHQSGFIHCDLKPNNILVNNSDEVKLIDFGQACKIGTVKERIQGTPDFIAPEQVKCEPLSVRTDVFNFGATLYWALSGGQKIPTLYTLKKSDNSFLFDEKIASPRDLNPKVPEPLSNLTMDCVKTKPEKRPGTVGEIARRLEVMAHALSRRQAN